MAGHRGCSIGGFFVVKLRVRCPRMIRSHFISALAVWFFVMQLLSGAGVAVTKEQKFHADSTARPFAFDTVRDYGPFVVFETGTRAISIERSTFLEYVEVPARFPKELVSDEQVAPFRESLKKIEGFVQRFPLSEPLLRTHLEALRALIANYDGGRVLVEKTWVAKTEYLKQQQMKANAAAEAERKRLALEAEEERTKKQQAANLAAEQQKQMEAAIPLAEAQIGEASLKGALFRIYKKSDTGVLVEILTPPAEDPPVVVLVEDGNTRPLQENVTYQGSLFYSGNYPSEGKDSMVRAYCLDRTSAARKLSFRLSRPNAPKAIASFRSWEPRSRSSSSSYTSGDMVWVDGYFRSDGTWVSGHYRNAPTPPTPFYSAPSYSSSSSSGSSGSVHVNGYYRKNGTYVHSYTRRK